jgi:hypothetical protein
MLPQESARLSSGARPAELRPESSVPAQKPVFTPGASCFCGGQAAQSRGAAGPVRQPPTPGAPRFPPVAKSYFLKDAAAVIRPGLFNPA